MSASSKTKETLTNIVLLTLRLGSAALMLTHGWPKMMKLVAGGDIKFADPFGIGAMPSLVLTVFAEVVCASLVGIGFKTRLATIPLIITMLTAVFIVHLNDPVASQEKGYLYLLIYLMLLVKGGGRFSFDYLILGKKG